MKRKYLSELKEKLVSYQASKKDMDDILSDYDQLYEDALASGKSDVEVWQMLGNPEEIVDELRDTLQQKREKNIKTKIIAVMPFMSLGFYYDLWNPGWLVFLIIPMLGILHEKNIVKLIIYELSFVIAIGFYLYMGYVENTWTFGALGFLLPVAMGLIFGDIHIMVGDLNGIERKKAITMVSMILVAIGIFLSLGFGLGGWAWAWQVFLLIPVTAIILFDKFRLTAIMPFIAVILFFSLGYFLGLFHISWLAFLLIPITAIIENA